MEDALRKLGSEAVNSTLDNRTRTSNVGTDPFEDVKKFFMLMESFTPRLIAAMRRSIAEMDIK